MNMQTGNRVKYLTCLVFIPAFFAALPGMSEEERKDLACLQFPSGEVIAAEIVESPQELARGLMFRDHLEPGEGMFFIFPSLDFHSIWMKNTKISLDIIWLSPELRVIHIERNVPPCYEDPCPSYLPLQKAAYVLEVKGGVAEKEGLSPGDTILLLGK